MEAMVESSGNIQVAANTLGIHHRRLYDRIFASPKLRALYHQDGGGMPDEEQQMVSKIVEAEVELPPEDKSALSTVKAQNVELLIDGYSKAGVSKETLDKIAVLGTFEKFAAQFLVGALQSSHSIAVYQELKLLEFSENQLKELELEMAKPEKSRDENKIKELKKNYLKSVELCLKSYDRIAHGTEIMARLVEPHKKNTRKPGFEPI